MRSIFVEYHLEKLRLSLIDVDLLYGTILQLNLKPETVEEVRFKEEVFLANAFIRARNSGASREELRRALGLFT